MQNIPITESPDNQRAIDDITPEMGEPTERFKKMLMEDSRQGPTTEGITNSQFEESGLDKSGLEGNGSKNMQNSE